MKFDWLKSRQTKYGAYSATYILVVLACLVAVNYLADRYNKTFDATKDKLYSLSDQTLKILGDLDRDLKIYYFDQSSFEPDRVRAKLQRELDPGAVLLVAFEQNPFPGLTLEEATGDFKVYRQPAASTPP